MPAARYMQKGTTRFYFVPTVASAVLLPTVAEVAAGTRLDSQIAEVNGFNFTNNPIATPDLASSFVSNIPGEDTADTSNIMFYELKGVSSNPIKAALAKGTIGYVVIFPYGTAGATPAIGDLCDVWPAEVASNSRGYSAGNEAGKYNVVFSTLSPPGVDKVLAA